MAEVRAVSSNGEYSFSKPSRDEIVLVPGHGVRGDVHAGVTVRHRSRVRADPSQPNLRQVHLISGELFDEVGAAGFVVAPGQLGENVTTVGVDLLGLPRGTVLRFGPAIEATGPDEETGPGVMAGIPHGAAAEPGAGAEAVLLAARRAELEPAVAAAVRALASAIERERSAETGDSRPAVVVTGLRNPCPQIDHFQGGLLKEVAFKGDDGAFVRRAGVMAVVLRGGVVRPGDAVVVVPPPGEHERLDRV